MKRPSFFQLKNGSKAALPFTDNEYKNRLASLRKIISKNNLDAVILTSMQNIAYYSGFLYCSFGRPYACIVTSKNNIVVSANIDASQPWRRCYGENLIYSDWERDNYLKAIISILKKVKRIGVENDHLTLERQKNLKDALGNPELIDVALYNIGPPLYQKYGEEGAKEVFGRWSDCFAGNQVLFLGKQK